MTAAKACTQLCESCRLQPATTSVALGLVISFAVCDGCRPPSTPLNDDVDAILVAPDLH